MKPHSSKSAGLPPGVHDTDPPRPEYSEVEEARWRKESWEYVQLNFEEWARSMIEEALIEAGVPNEERGVVAGELWQRILKERLP